MAIAYLMQKAPYVFPIIGGRKVEHLHQNLEALEISLTPEQIKTLDNIVPFDKGFPFSGFVSSAPAEETFVVNTMILPGRRLRLQPHLQVGRAFR